MESSQLLADLGYLKEIVQSLPVPYTQAIISTLGGVHRASLMFTVGLDPREDWSYGILENSSYGKFSLRFENGKWVLEKISGNKTEKIRKTSVKDLDKMVQKVRALPKALKGVRANAHRRNAAFGNDAVEDEISEGMAEGFIVGSSEVGEAFESGEAELSPEAEQALADLIIRFGAKIVEMNGCSLSDCYARAEEIAEDADRESGFKLLKKAPDANLFGYYLAMQAQGHGVGWNDYFPEAGITFPDAQAYLELEGDQIEMYGGEIDPRFQNEI